MASKVLHDAGDAAQGMHRVQGLGSARVDDKAPVTCVTLQVALEEEERQVKKLLLEASVSLTPHSQVRGSVPFDHSLPFKPFGLLLAVNACAHLLVCRSL